MIMEVVDKEVPVIGSRPDASCGFGLESGFALPEVFALRRALVESIHVYTYCSLSTVVNVPHRARLLSLLCIFFLYRLPSKYLLYETSK